MRLMSKTFQARVLSKPAVVVNLLEFKQKPLVDGPKTLENGWNIALGDYFNVNVDAKSITLPTDRETVPAITVVETTKENQKALFKDIQLAFKLAKKVK